MFAQGAQRKAMRVVGLAGLLNLPYYLLLIAGTAVLSEQVMQMAENTVLLFSLIGIWLVIAVIIDIRRYRQREASASI
jgi:membrane-associated protein